MKLIKEAGDEKCSGEGCGELEPPNLGYLQKHEWMRKMSRTHNQRKCKVCGLYSVWTKKGVKK